VVRRLLGVVALVAAFLVPPAAIGGLRAVSYLDGVYAGPAVADVPAELRDARPAYDPGQADRGGPGQQRRGGRG
jgi:hypothetical protein